MTDSPLLPKPSPPPSRLDQWVAAFGNAARPFAIYVTSGSASIATVVVAQKVQNGNDGAIFLAAVGGLVGAIYGFKAWENNKAKAADVEMAKAGVPSA